MDLNDGDQVGEYQSTLAYYKQKVEDLEGQRMNWLSKFEECNEKLNQKQEKQQFLRSLKDGRDQAENDILHHQVACFDQMLNTLALDRNNQNLEFEEAEQLVKLRELAQEYPAAIGYLQKPLPCIGTLNGNIIQNELNLHTSEKSKNPQNSLNKKKKHPASSTASNKTQSNKNLPSHKKSLDQLLKLQIIETKKLNDKELHIMKYQEQLLEKSIKEYQDKEIEKNKKERNIVKQFNQKHKELEGKYKKLAESYFQYRRKHKNRLEKTKLENKLLTDTHKTLDDKVGQEIKTYEKQNKAKQALILRKSEDFQEDYKARMRAKQRNLQALKQNYEKMQEMCIVKVRKLQATVERANHKLQDAEEKRNFLLIQLRQQLKNLEKRCNIERIEKAKLDMKIKKKMQEEKIKYDEERQRNQKIKKQAEKEEMMKTAYKKTGLSNKTLMKKKKQNIKHVVNNAESSDNDDSLEISDIENIRKQINDLEKKLSSEDK